MNQPKQLVTANGDPLHYSPLANTVRPQPPHMEAFTFGDPVPVLDQRASVYFGECSMVNQKWYSPPMDLDGLALTMRASPHHASALYVKRNILVSTFEPHPLLSQLEFSRFVLDFLVFGNGYIERHNAMSGRPMRLRAPLAKYMRVGKDDGQYFFVTGSIQDDHEFELNTICHLMEPDINQEVYGSPEYLSAMNAAWLDEAATLFRRKYYLNGSHAGFIMYVTDPAQNKDDIDNMRKALKDSKGVGNFRNLFLYSPNGKKDGIQILPISEVAAKDEFWNIKEASRVDIAAVHRVPPQLMGATPTNTSGFGDVEKAARVFVINELMPLQQRLLAINEWLGQEVIRFKPYALENAQA
jgi:PBSX family phage portal protein